MLDKTSEQKIILLTGASRGIGHATVRKFSEEKWRVITCSRQAFDQKCPWPGGEANHIQVDLSNPNNTLEAIEEIKCRLNGKLHALVNNAGISPKNEKGNRLDSINTDLSIWGQVFHVNFFASVILARGMQKELVKAKGTIVNVEIYRRGEQALLDFAIERDDIPLNSVDGHLMLNDSTGFIRVTRFSRTTAKEFQSALIDLVEKDMTQLVVDLRAALLAASDANLDLILFCSKIVPL